jgi:hypothetical protein
LSISNCRAEKDIAVKLPAAANRRRAASAVLALALLSEITGFAIAALPAAAAPRAADPTITITAGGDRTASDTVSGLAGVGFGVSPPATSTNCPTGTGGTCTASVTSGRTYTITQTGAPSGWFLNPKLGIGTGEDIDATSYTSLTTPTVHSDISIPEASSGSPDQRQCPGQPVGGVAGRPASAVRVRAQRGPAVRPVKLDHQPR